jgi:hypothetical protein
VVFSAVCPRGFAASGLEVEPGEYFGAIVIRRVRMRCTHLRH